MAEHPRVVRHCHTAVVTAVVEREPAEVAQQLPRTARRWLLLEVILAGALTAATYAVHDVRWMLDRPYWLDEAWVAITTRFSLVDLPSTTASTPVGWSLLLRLLPGHALRLLPLTFAALSVTAAYVLVRGLSWGRRWQAVGAGLLSGTAALLVPSALDRQDLKQYTADAFFTLVVLAALGRLEAAWSRRRLALLVLVSGPAMAISAAAAFAGAAAFVALVARTACQRDRRRLAEAVVAGAVTAGTQGVVYATLFAGSAVPGLKAYWSPFYVPTDQGLGTAASFVCHLVELELPQLGLGPSWVAGPLVLLGLLALARRGRPAVAAAVVLLAAEMLVLGALELYPFLDTRTSHFLCVLAAVLAAAGLADVAVTLGRWAPVGAALLALSTGVFLHAAQGHVRAYVDASGEDVRTPAAYVAAHRAPGDVVVVTTGSNWGFGFYWSQDRPLRQADPDVLQGYVVGYPRSARIVVAAASTPVAVATALYTAAAELGPGGRLWLVRTHMGGSEPAYWAELLAEQHLTERPVPGIRRLYVATRG